MIQDPTNASLAIDGRSLERLRADAARDPKGAARQAAGQFEAMFMQQLLKSMRDAMPKSGMWDGPGQSMYQSMLDGQLAQKVSNQPGGLADVIARQLSRHLQGGVEGDALTAASSGVLATAEDSDGMQGIRPIDPAELAGGQTSATLALAARLRPAEAPPAGLASPASLAAPTPSASSAPGAQPAVAAATIGRGTGLPLAPGGVVVVDGKPMGVPAAGPRADAARRAWREMQALQGGPAGSAARPGGAPRQAAFVQKLWAPAQAAERATGLPAGFIVGQAALETGWGRAEMRLPDGSSAHNLFGIKAGKGWKGPTVDAVTTEYVEGRAVRKVERFRAYPSYEHAFRDWAGLIAGSPRYASVMRAGHTVEGFAQGLQRAGYATDPRYAEKLTRTIHQAQRLQRLVV